MYPSQQFPRCITKPKADVMFHETFALCIHYFLIQKNLGCGKFLNDERESTLKKTAERENKYL